MKASGGETKCQEVEGEVIIVTVVSSLVCACECPTCVVCVGGWVCMSACVVAWCSSVAMCI